MLSERNDKLITNITAREYFHEAVQDAVTNQQLTLCTETVIYITNLLTIFIRSEKLFDITSEGLMLKPLAILYGEATGAHRAEDRERAIKRVGDIALFISGLYAASLKRSMVDVDYYISMGGCAYAYLADSSQMSKSSIVFKEVFAELSLQFDRLVDVLSEVGENTNLDNGRDILRLYEIWLSTGSQRAAAKLYESGIYPVHSKRSKH